MVEQAAWKGSKRQLVLAFDLGTTYSGISYSVLDPGQVPVVKVVTKFPCQEDSKGTSKIPTVIYYDQGGHVQAVGAETQTEETYQDALSNNWVKAEWFKIHLRPKHVDGTDLSHSIPSLPPNKSAVAVVADFLKYLYECAKRFILETHFNGDQLWESFEGRIDFVLSHPNGWEGVEQAQIRRATVLAGLVPSMEAGRSRVSLVTEGEASLHFAILHGLPLDELHDDNGVVVVDAGGGTIDINAYRQTKSNSKNEGLGFEEISIPKSGFHGSVFVTIQAHAFLRGFLQESQFIDDLDHIAHCFDQTTKLRFCDDQRPHFIRFGNQRDKDEKHGIRSGQLQLNGADIAKFFDPSIDWIVNTVLAIEQESNYRISHVVLVGGFSASDWLYQQVRGRLATKVLPASLSFTRPHADSRVNKAVSDGAIHFYLNRFVGGRISRVTYGVICNTHYKPTNLKHVKRKHLMYTNLLGEQMLRNHFSMLLEKGARVAESTELRLGMNRLFRSVADIVDVHQKISIYRGEDKNPEWADVDEANYETLGVAHADFSAFRPKLEEKKDSQGDTCYQVKFVFILSVGLSEFGAQVAWIDAEDGLEKRGPATIIYDPQD